MHSSPLEFWQSSPCCSLHKGVVTDHVPGLMPFYSCDHSCNGPSIAILSTLLLWDMANLLPMACITVPSWHIAASLFLHACSLTLPGDTWIFKISTPEFDFFITFFSFVTFLKSVHYCVVNQVAMLHTMLQHAIGLSSWACVYNVVLICRLLCASLTLVWGLGWSVRDTELHLIYHHLCNSRSLWPRLCGAGTGGGVASLCSRVHF